MAKRRKKKNKSANNQPPTQPDVDVVAEPMSSTTAAAAEEGVSEADSETSDRPAVATPGASSTGFLQSTKEELEKVVWPDRQQLISESVAVFLMVSLSAFIFSFIDNLFRWVSTLVFG